MEVIELKNIERKDSLIHYINKYDCVIVYKIGDNLKECKVEIILEKTAIGTTDIQLININDDLQTNVDALNNFITEQKKKGVLV